MKLVCQARPPEPHSVVVCRFGAGPTPKGRVVGLSAHIFVRDAKRAIAFYREAFGATELFRNVLPDGTLLFVELAFGVDRLLISEETPHEPA